MSITDDIAKLFGGRPSTRGNRLGKCPAHEDRRPSLTYKESNGKLLLKCWAGCTFEQVKDALVVKGILPASFQCEESQDNIWIDFHCEPVGRFGAEFDSIDYSLVCLYKYHDADGKFIGFKARFKPKTFRFFSHEARDRNKAKRALSLPYRLPQVLRATEEKIPIHVFEGEKDCDNALALGLEECTSFGSASDALPLEWQGRFKECQCVVWADNDKPGLKRAVQIAQFLHVAGAEVKVVMVPTGKDLSDWLDAGATIDDVAALVSRAPLWLPEHELVEKLGGEGALPK